MTQLFVDPILAEGALPFLDWSGRSRGNTVVVYLDDRAHPATADAVTGRCPPLMTRLTQRYRRYDVDVAQHPVTMELTVPSKDEALEFRVILFFTWTVHDPVQVARVGLHNAKSVYWPILNQMLRPIGRQFAIEDCAEAEAKMNAALPAHPLAIGGGLTIMHCAVDLHLDADTQDHLAARVGSRRAGERASDEHALQMLRDRHAQQEAELRHALERVMSEHKGRMEQQQVRHQIQLKEQRMKFYQGALKGDGLDVLVLQLLEHPEDIKAVVGMLKDRKDDFFGKVRDVIKDLMEHKLVNGADVDPLRDQTIEHLRAALQAAAPHLPPARDEDCPLQPSPRPQPPW